MGGYRSTGFFGLICAALAALHATLNNVDIFGAMGLSNDSPYTTIGASVALFIVSFIVMLGGKPAAKPTVKPVLAIDFDEVCVGYVPGFIKFMNATHGTKLTIEKFHSYKFWEVAECEITKEEATDRVYEFHASPFFKQLEPIPGAHKALKTLAEKFELHVVTSRQKDIEEETLRCMNEHFPNVFTDTHFGNHYGKSGAKVSKPDMCKKIGAVALVDDSLDYARQCADAGMVAYVFGDYAWNREDGPMEVGGKRFRAYNWDEVVDLTNDLAAVIAKRKK